MSHRKYRSRLVLAAAFGGIALAGLAIASQGGGQPASQPAAGQPEPGQAQPRQDMGGILVAGLKNTPGCLDVQLCQWQGGKQSIVAWFKDKESVLKWYHNPIHKGMMRGMGGAQRAPMQAVPDDIGPVMVIATITLSQDGQKVPGFPVPISQVSIELFKPLDAGASLNGRLNPKDIDLPNHLVLDDAAGEGEKPAGGY